MNMIDIEPLSVFWLNVANKTFWFSESDVKGQSYNCKILSMTESKPLNGLWSYEMEHMPIMRKGPYWCQRSRSLANVGLCGDSMFML